MKRRLCYCDWKASPLGGGKCVAAIFLVTDSSASVVVLAKEFVNRVLFLE